jgi:hypothetical protein
VVPPFHRSRLSPAVFVVAEEFVDPVLRFSRRTATKKN